MPRQGRTPEHQAKLNKAYRRAVFDKYADPLWKALAKGNHQEVARLQAELRRVIARQGDN